MITEACTTIYYCWSSLSDSVVRCVGYCNMHISTWYWWISLAGSFRWCRIWWNSSTGYSCTRMGSVISNYRATSCSYCTRFWIYHVLYGHCCVALQAIILSIVGYANMYRIHWNCLCLLDHVIFDLSMTSFAALFGRHSTTTRADGRPTLQYNDGDPGLCRRLITGYLLPKIYYRRVGCRSIDLRRWVNIYICCFFEWVPPPLFLVICTSQFDGYPQLLEIGTYSDRFWEPKIQKLKDIWNMAPWW